MKSFRVTFRVDAKDEDATAESLRDLVEFALLHIFVDSEGVDIQIVEEVGEG